MRHLPACAWVVVLSVAVGGASAQQMDRAEMAFNFMFRAQLAEAAATESPADDAALARTFLDALERPNLADELKARLKEKAYEYGIKHPAGLPAAREAVDLLEEADPDNPDAYDDMRLTIEEQAFEHAPRGERDADGLLDMYLSMGDLRMARRDAAGALHYAQRALAFTEAHLLKRKADAEAAVARAVRLGKVLEEIDRARAALAANPGDAAAAARLLELLGLELDSPAEAIEAVPKLEGNPLHANLSLAATPLPQLPATDALALARWYVDQAQAQGAALKDRMLIRAKLYYSEYLAKHATEDESRLAAKHELRGVDDKLAMIGVSRKLARKRVAKLAGGGREQRSPQIDAAIDKGVAWIYGRMDAKEFWETSTEHNQGRNFAGKSAIAVYALLMAEEDPRANRELARAIRWVFAADMQGTYAICFRMHAWELLPDRERYRKVMVGDAAWLRAAQTAEGFYDYTMDPNKTKPRRDISATLAGGLGLWLASEVGQIEIAPQHWQRLAAACIRGQQDDGGWSYVGDELQVSYGSMTAAGLTCLLVSREHLPEAMHEQADKAIADGMQWLNYQFVPDRNPIKNAWTYYYLAAVQHVGLLSGTREFNQMDWYETGTQHLVKSQKEDGSWGNLHQTAFAIAFLTRGGVSYGSEAADEPHPSDGEPP